MVDSRFPINDGLSPRKGGSPYRLVQRFGDSPIHDSTQAFETHLKAFIDQFEYKPCFGSAERDPDLSASIPLKVGLLRDEVTLQPGGQRKNGGPGTYLSGMATL